MRKMPPLPNRRQPTNPPARQPMEAVFSKLPVPLRYNSIERVRDSKKDLTEQQQKVEGKVQKGDVKGEVQLRKNYLIRRPISARSVQVSKESNRSRGSAQRGRQSPHYSKKMRVSMPSVSAESWVLYEMREERFMTGRANFKRREVASLTKIMNLITILNICEAAAIIPQRIRVTVTREATALNGTTAELKAGLQLSLEDLFYGMMLPSGNDAAHLIAQVGGVVLRMMRDGEVDRGALYGSQALSRLVQAEETAVSLFLHQMNAMSRKMGLSRSSWANPHGLSNTNNLSTAEDIARLCMHCMKNPKFREIVGTKNYSCCIYRQGEEGIEKGWLKWENTNKLLWQGWDGVKTGVTPNAGPCLAASTTRFIAGREFEFLVVLLNSESMEARWKEIKDLTDWIVADPSLS